VSCLEFVSAHAEGCFWFGIAALVALRALVRDVLEAMGKLPKP
jgi:hypothetical protein